MRGVQRLSSELVLRRHHKLGKATEKFDQTVHTAFRLFLAQLMALGFYRQVVI